MEFFKATYFEERLDQKKMNRIFQQKEKATVDLHELQFSKQQDKSTSKRERCVSISPEDAKRNRYDNATLKLSPRRVNAFESSCFSGQLNLPVS